MHVHKARAIQRRLVNAGLTPNDRVCMYARTRVSALVYTIRVHVYSCLSCVRDICHRKPHNGPSHHGSPIVHLCHMYARSSSRVPCTHRAPCIEMKSMHQSTRLQVSIRSTQKPPSLPPVVRHRLSGISGN